MNLTVFGQRAPQSPPNLGFPIHYTGHLNDDLSLSALYSAADAMVIPSRQDKVIPPKNDRGDKWNFVPW